MHPPPEVLDRFPTLPWRAVQFLGARAGFSGAQVWRLETTSGDYCLKAWPADGMTVERLSSIHQAVLAARAENLAYLPHVIATLGHSTLIQHGGRLWDLSTWLRGAADFHERPSAARLQAACLALGQLHRTWQRGPTRTGPCPGVRRRLDALQHWQDLRATGWQPVFATDDPMQPWAERALSCVERDLRAAQTALTPWSDVALLLHPCWCDPWHDHVLFTDDCVTGLIDYGSVKEDHVAVDLARLLGSLVGDDYSQWELGLAAYQTVRPLTDRERTLAPLLERTGLLVAATNWLRWLYHERRAYENPAAVANRLQNLVLRLEKPQAANLPVTSFACK
jgi:Ser/Thr protein kinase RdoA (MazF antagonist)